MFQLAVATVVTTAEGTTNFLYAPYLAAYGYALPSIGTLSALFAIFRLVSRVPSGAAYRASRARGQLAFWLVVFTLSTSGFALASGSLVPVVLLTVVHGYAFGALGTLNLAVVIDLTEGKSAGASMGWYTAALSTGYAIGSFAGGFVADHFGIPIALAAFGALPAIFALGVVVAPPRFEGAPRSSARGAGLAGLFAAHRDLDPRVWLAFVIVLYINLLSDSVDTFYPLFGLSIGLPLAASGALKGLKSGGATFIRVFAGVVFRFVDHRTVNFWSVLLFALSSLVLPYVLAFPALVPVFLGAGLARGLLRVTSAAMVAELRNEGKDMGVASGVYNAGLDVGAIVGPSVGGVLGDAFGLGAMFQVVAVGSLALYFAVALATPKGRAALAIAGPSFGRRGE